MKSNWFIYFLLLLWNVKEFFVLSANNIFVINNIWLTVFYLHFLMDWLTTFDSFIAFLSLYMWIPAARSFCSNEAKLKRHLYERLCQAKRVPNDNSLPATMLPDENVA